MTDLAGVEEIEDDDRAVAAALVDLAPVLHHARWPVDVAEWSYRLRYDHTLSLELRLCGEWGIPHSEFLEWDDVDRAKALAYALHEGRRCRECGIHPDEWDPADYPPPFESAVRECAGCAELARFNRHQQEQAKNAPSLLDGVKPYLRRRD